MTSLWVSNRTNLTHRAKSPLKTWQSNIIRQNTLKGSRAPSSHWSYFNHCHPGMTTLESLTSPAATESSLDVHLSLDPSCTRGPVSFYTATIICLLLGFQKYWRFWGILPLRLQRVIKVSTVVPPTSSNWNLIRRPSVAVLFQSSHFP